MNTIKATSLVVLLFTAFLFSCDGDTTYKPENPLSRYLQVSNFTEVLEAIDQGDYEFGLAFKPKGNGEISAIHVRLPDDRTDLRITIWGENETILRTETITSVTAGVGITQAITPLAVEKGKEYMITFNSNDWYEYAQPDHSSAQYPVTIGNIIITAYGYNEGTSQTYPYFYQTDYYAGDLSFTFKRME